MPNTALLVIDVQVAVVDGAFRAREVLDAIADMADRARQAEAPVIYLQHESTTYAPMNRGAPGWAIHPDVAPMSGDLVIGKLASDGFYGTTLADDLARLGIRRLVVCGLQTEFCVDATCRAALSHGLAVTLASDAHTTGDAVTPAETTIRHHNYVLSHIAHPDGPAKVMKSATVEFD